MVFVLLTSHPYLPFCRHIIRTLHFIGFRNVFGFISVFFLLLIKLFPCNYLSRECGLYKASDLILGDHVLEKYYAVNWIDCP